MSREIDQMSPFCRDTGRDNRRGTQGTPLKGGTTHDVPNVPAKCPAGLSRLKTFEQVSEVWSYDAHTGFLHWKVRSAGRWPGKCASSRTSGSYVTVIHEGVAYKAHRLAWLLHFGHWPEFEIDHINGNRADNRIANLRDVPHRINQLNQKCHRRKGALA